MLLTLVIEISVDYYKNINLFLNVALNFGGIRFQTTHKVENMREVCTADESLLFYHIG